METLLKTILIIVVALWLLRLFLRYMLRWLIKRQQQRFAQQFEQAMRGDAGAYQNNKKQSNKKQGEVTIKTQNANQKVVSRNVGETVDFEEINEELSKD